MVTALKSSTDILGTTVTSARDIGTKASNLNEAKAAVTNPAKYISRVELDKSGLSRKFDELQGTLLNVNSQDTTAKITKGRLNNEQKALKQVNDIMVKFESEKPQNNSLAGTTQAKVNRALAEIEIALRARDTSGKYVWGGKDPATDPISKVDAAGNRVPVSLVNETNIQNNLITNNYSSTAPNESIITVSSEHEVRESFLHPGHEAIAKAVGYLNMIKENADAIDAGGAVAAIYTDQELAAAQQEKVEALGALKIQIDTEVKKVEKAFEINKRDAKDAMKSNNELFSANIVERTQKMHDLLVSMAALISISNVDAKVSYTLANLRV